MVSVPLEAYLTYGRWRVAERTSITTRPAVQVSPSSSDQATEGLKRSSSPRKKSYTRPCSAARRTRFEYVTRDDGLGENERSSPQAAGSPGRLETRKRKRLSLPCPANTERRRQSPRTTNAGASWSS